MNSPLRTLSAYIHVPYCSVRCGYCDFNTYTGSELRGAKRSDFVQHVGLEIAHARRELSATSDDRTLDTAFFGGGTPTILPASDIAAVLDLLRDSFGFSADAEITVEANPDTVDREYFDALRASGVTRVSLGMQSSVPHVLRTLDRTHDPVRIPGLVEQARASGVAVSVDVIYGTPGESIDDWQRTLDALGDLQLDHVSAYALIVEDGTALARKIKRGEIAAPDPDLHAEMYELADERFELMGLSWYEVSNWSRSIETQSRHNLAYWRNHDWWGFGAGAHSHIGDRRWWNIKHPAAYGQAVSRGVSPQLGEEVPTEAQRSLEHTMLGLRIREGIPLSMLTPRARLKVAELISTGLLDGIAAIEGTGRLTLRGRLLADTVIRALTD